MLATILKVGIFAVVVFGGLLLAMALSGFFAAIRPVTITSAITPADFKVPFETVTLTTSDNIKLHAWFVPAKDASVKKTIILMHGYPADKGDILPVLIFLQQHYNLLLFDFRYHGQSEGAHTTIGAKEVEDCLAAVSYLKNRGIRDIGVWGFSMGGAVAIMAAEKSPAIKAVVADSSYARLGLLTSVFYGKLKFINKPLVWLTNYIGKLFFGVHPMDVAPVKAAETLNIPILVIHSKDDQLITFEHAQMLQKALKNNPNATFYFVEGLAHGHLTPDYQTRVETFFEKYL